MRFLRKRTRPKPPSDTVRALMLIEDQLERIADVLDREYIDRLHAATLRLRASNRALRETVKQNEP